MIILGSFLVPGTLSAFALSRKREGYLTMEEVLLGFFMAGTLAVVSTALLETYLLPAAKGTFIGVAIIEELGKLIVLIAVAHRVRHRGPRDGIVLGAIVGAGFASFESAGYALQAMLDNLDDRPVVNILESEAFRAVLSPFGHITWTALLGGALFASAHHGARYHAHSPARPHRARRDDAAHAVGSVLRLGGHAHAWRARPGLGAAVAQLAALARRPDVRGAHVLQRLLRRSPVHPRGLIGAVWIIHTWRMYGRRDAAEAPPAQATPDAS